MSLKLEFLGSERLELTSVHTFSLKIEVTSTSCYIYLRRDTLLLGLQRFPNMLALREKKVKEKEIWTSSLSRLVYTFCTFENFFSAIMIIRYICK